MQSLQPQPIDQLVRNLRDEHTYAARFHELMLTPDPLHEAFKQARAAAGDIDNSYAELCAFGDHCQELRQRARPLDANLERAREAAANNFDVFKLKTSQVIHKREAQLAESVAHGQRLLEVGQHFAISLEPANVRAMLADVRSRHRYACDIDQQALRAAHSLARVATLWATGLLLEEEKGKPYFMALTTAPSSYAVDALRRSSTPKPRDMWRQTDFLWAMDLAVVQRVMARFEGIVGLLEVYDMMVKSAYEQEPTIIRLYVEVAKDKSGQILPRLREARVSA